MNINLNMTLDEIIDFVLGDKYLTYDFVDIIKLNNLMQERLRAIVDPDEKEFYEGVVDGLIGEMEETIRNHVGASMNPLKEEYDSLSKRLIDDINKNASSPQSPKRTFSAVTQFNSQCSSYYSFFICSDYLSRIMATHSIRDGFVASLMPGHKNPYFTENSEDDLFLDASPLLGSN